MKQHLISILMFALFTISGQVYSQTITIGGNGLFPSDLFDLNGTLIFRTGTSHTEKQLWKSDGTEAGTVMVKNIQVSLGYEIFDDKLYFCGNDGIHGWELWRSDGTEAGTVMIKDIRSGVGSSSPLEFSVVDELLFFSASNGINGTELWKSDGTEAGTVMVKDVNPGSGYSAPQNMANINGTLFFKAIDATHGYELWKSDGTASGTVMVKDIRVGSGNSDPNHIVNKDGIAYFVADEGVNGVRLWKSDGTEEGTRIVKDISVVNSSSTISELINVNGTLFFRGNDATNGAELWISDGTEDGTVLLKDIYSGTQSSNPSDFVESNGQLFFRAIDAAHGSELWKSDGTPAGTVLVKDIYRDTRFSRGNPQLLTDVNGVLYFAANNTTARCIWKTDGTEDGTILVYNPFPVGSGYIVGLRGAGNYVYFITEDMVSSDYTLWSHHITTNHIVNYSVIGQNGSITAAIVDGSTISNGEYVEEGSNIHFSAVPANNYKVKEWKVGDVVQAETGNEFIYSNLQNDISISVEFEQNTTDIFYPLVEEVLLSPNPTKGDFSIFLDKTYSTVKLEIVDKRGGIIETKTFNNTNYIPYFLSGNPDLYLINIYFDNLKKTLKIVKI